jgi:hypothetical protein
MMTDELWNQIRQYPAHGHGWGDQTQVLIAEEVDRLRAENAALKAERDEATQLAFDAAEVATVLIRHNTHPDGDAAVRKFLKKHSKGFTPTAEGGPPPTYGPPPAGWRPSDHAEPLTEGGANAATN